MPFSWNTLSAIPRLTSYEQALAHYNRITPIRGDANKPRPLGLRRQKWMHIKLVRKDVCIFFMWDGTRALIRYRPNGDVVVTAHSFECHASDNELVGRVLGLPCATYYGRVWVRTSAGYDYLRATTRNWRWDPHKKKRIKQKRNVEDNIFRFEEGRWVYVNPPTIMRHVLDREALKAVRQRYAPAIESILATAKLRRDCPPNDEEQVPFLNRLIPNRLRPAEITSISPLHTYFSHPRRVPYWYLPRIQRKFITLLSSDKLEDHYTAYMWASRHARDPAAVNEFIDLMLIVHLRDELLVPVHSSGAPSPVRDRYNWVFKLAEA